MTTSLISLISILAGIIGANAAGFAFKKYSFGITGNTIAGVFGSILLIKSFGRLGFDPNSIMQFNRVDYRLLSINLILSFLGGGIAVILIHMLKTKISTIK